MGAARCHPYENRVIRRGALMCALVSPVYLKCTPAFQRRAEELGACYTVA